MIGWCWVNVNTEYILCRDLFYSCQMAKTTRTRRCFLLLDCSQQRLSKEGVLLSLAYNVTAWPWPATTGELMLMLVRLIRQLMLSPSAKDSEGYFTSDIIKHSVCLFPTWRRADRERLKFLVRHREWDNIVAVWQQPKAEEKLQIHRLESWGSTRNHCGSSVGQTNSCRVGGDDDDECLNLVASLSLNSLSRNT